MERPDLVSTTSTLHPREREHQAMNRAYMFGTFRLLCESQSQATFVWRRQKAKSLLKWFFLSPYRPHAAEQLIDLFWPDACPEAGLRNLYVSIHYIRRVLEPMLQPNQESRYLHRDKNNFYWLELDQHWWLDTNEVEHLYSRACSLEQTNQSDDARFYYRKIVSYCSQGFLPDDKEDPVFLHHRQRYTYIYLNVLQRLIQLCMECKNFDEAFEYSYMALLVDPYLETAIKSVVEVYSHQCHQSASTSQRLGQFRTFLQNELGVDTSEEWLQRIISY